MTSKTFVTGTVIDSAWLNDVNTITYNTTTGTGSIVYSTSPTISSPTLTTPILGVATATTLNKLTFTQPATGATLTLANNSTFITTGNVTYSGAFASTFTLTGTTGVTIPTSGTLAVTTQATDTFGALTDVTTNNVSATAHGFCPKFPNNSTTFLRGDGTYAVPPGTGTVTTVSVVTANGFAGTVATATTTPAITLTTSVTGLLKGNGTSVTAAINSDLPSMSATVGGAVPTPPNNTTTFLRGDGTFAAPTSSSALTLLSTLTPTAAAAVNALSAFTASYDAYLIIGEGICPNVSDIPQFQLATGGVLDTGSNYLPSPLYSNANFASTQTFAYIIQAGGTNVGTAGRGIDFEIKINNANNTSQIKIAWVREIHEGDTGNTYNATVNNIVYQAANTVSGIGFSWASANNFKAQGKIRIYGISNT